MRLKPAELKPGNKRTDVLFVFLGRLNPDHARAVAGRGDSLFLLAPKGLVVGIMKVVILTLDSSPLNKTEDGTNGVIWVDYL